MFGTIRFLACNQRDALRNAKSIVEVSNNISGEGTTRIGDYCSKASESTVVLEENSSELSGPCSLGQNKHNEILCHVLQ